MTNTSSLQRLAHIIFSERRKKKSGGRNKKQKEKERKGAKVESILIFMSTFFYQALRFGLRHRPTGHFHEERIYPVDVFYNITRC